MQIYYINRDVDRERRSFIEQQIEGVRLIGTRFPAITPETLPPIRSDSPLLFSSPGQAAGLASHLALIRQIARSDEAKEGALILEDDSFLYPLLDLNVVIASAPAGFEILQLSTSNKQYLHILYDLYKRHQFCWYGWHSSFWGTHAYYITKKAAISMASRYFPNEEITISGVLMPYHNMSDHLIFKGLAVYTSCYPLACQRDFASSVHPAEAKTKPDRSDAMNECLRIWRDDPAPKHASSSKISSS